MGLRRGEQRAQRARAYRITIEAPGLVDQDALEEFMDPGELLFGRIVVGVRRCRRRRTLIGRVLRRALLAILAVDASVASIVAAISLD